jgi:DNA-binding MarR family transcriptional regulator
VEKKRQDLVAALNAAVTGFQRATDAFDEAVAERFGVNRTDLRCLDLLFNGSLSAGALAEACGLSPAATTTLIDRLERKGYLRRGRDPGDRRRVVVEMTELARDRAWQFYGPLVKEGGADLARYSDAQLVLIADFLDRSRALVERHRDRARTQPLVPAPEGAS